MEMTKMNRTTSITLIDMSYALLTKHTNNCVRRKRNAYPMKLNRTRNQNLFKSSVLRFRSMHNYHDIVPYDPHHFFAYDSATSASHIGGRRSLDAEKASSLGRLP